MARSGKKNAKAGEVTAAAATTTAAEIPKTKPFPVNTTKNGNSTANAVVQEWINLVLVAFDDVEMTDDIKNKLKVAFTKCTWSRRKPKALKAIKVLANNEADIEEAGVKVFEKAKEKWDSRPKPATNGNFSNGKPNLKRKSDAPANGVATAEGSPAKKSKQNQGSQNKSQTTVDKRQKQKQKKGDVAGGADSGSKPKGKKGKGGAAKTEV